MTSRGDRIKEAIQDAQKVGEVDENGRPLIEYVALIALGQPLSALLEGERRGLDEIIDREMRRRNADQD